MGANPPGNPLQPLPSQDARGVPATLPVSGAKRIQPSRFLTGEAATISDTLRRPSEISLTMRDRTSCGVATASCSTSTITITQNGSKW